MSAYYAKKNVNNNLCNIDVSVVPESLGSGLQE
jgi:hypothetical protein